MAIFFGGFIMYEILLIFFNQLVGVIDLGWWFVITASAQVICFVINVALILNCKNFTKNKKKGVALIGYTFILLQAFLEKVVLGDVCFTFITLCLAVALKVPFAFIDKRKKQKFTAGQIGLAKRLNDVYEKQKNQASPLTIEEKENKSVLFSFEKLLVEENLPPSIVPEAVKSVETKEDYSGVKRAIDKTLRCDISETEKNQVVGLELTLLQIERGETHAEVKQKLNDGLSILLKIMAKYKV